MSAAASIVESSLDKVSWSYAEFRYTHNTRIVVDPITSAICIWHDTYMIYDINDVPASTCSRSRSRSPSRAEAVEPVAERMTKRGELRRLSLYI